MKGKGKEHLQQKKATPEISYSRLMTNGAELSGLGKKIKLGGKMNQKKQR